MDSRQRRIADYATLALVRRRRGTALETELRVAQREHERCLALEAERRLACEQRAREREDYVRSMDERTRKGRAVQLADIESARGHDKELQRLCEAAGQALQQAGSTVQAALKACNALRQRIAANEARIEAMDTQRTSWQRQAAMQAEDQEEDERADNTGPRPHA